MSTQHASSRISSSRIEEKKVQYPKQRRTKRRITTTTENLKRSTYTMKSSPSSSLCFSSPSIHDVRDGKIGYCSSTTSTMQSSLKCSQLTTGRYSNLDRPPQQTRHQQQQHQHHKQQSRLQQQSRQLPLERTHHRRQRRRHNDRLQQLARYLQAKTVPVNTTIPPMTQPEMAMPIWRMFYEHSEMIETEFRQLQKLELLTVVVQHQNTKKDTLDNRNDIDGNDGGDGEDDDDEWEQEYKQLKRSERILQHQIEQINKRFERIMARRREYRYDLARKKKNHPSRHDGDSLSVQSPNSDSTDLLTIPLPRYNESPFATETASILQPPDESTIDKSRQILLDQMNRPSNRTWLNKILTSTTKVKVVTASIIGTALLTNCRTRTWSHFQFRWYENSLVAKQCYHQQLHPLDVENLGTNNKLTMIGNIIAFSERKTNATRTNMMNTPSSSNTSQLERLHLSLYCDDQNHEDDDFQSGRFIKKSLIMKDDVNPSISMTTIRPDKTLR